MVEQYNNCVHPEVETSSLYKEKQVTIKFGASAGFGFSTIHERDLIGQKSTAEGTGFQAGLLVNLSYNTTWSFQTGALYTTYNTDVVNTYSLVEHHITYKLNYVELPLTVKYRLVRNPIAPYALIGAQAGFFLKDDRSLQVFKTLNGELESESEEGLELGVQSGFTAGGGVSVNFSGVETTAGLSYQINLVDLKKTLGVNIWAINLGVLF